MFINTKIKIDMSTGDIIFKEGYDYEGNVALCFGANPPDVPPPPPPPKPQQDTGVAVSEARLRQSEKRKKRTGVASTLLTGGRGLTAKATTEHKKLLSGTS